MKFLLLLSVLIIKIALLAQNDSLFLPSEEDPIIQRIQLDEPSEPLIRFHDELINLKGIWCFEEIDHTYWLIAPIEDAASHLNGPTLSFDYWGEVRYSNPENSSRQALFSYYSIRNSSLMLHYSTDEQTVVTEIYQIISHQEKVIQLLLVETKMEPYTEPSKRSSR